MNPKDIARRITQDPDLLIEESLEAMMSDPNYHPAEHLKELARTSGYGDYGFWDVVEHIAPDIDRPDLKQMILGAMAQATSDNSMLWGLELNLQHYFGRDSEVWKAWFDFMGEDAVMELAGKASDYYVEQGNWVRLMMNQPIPVDWNAVRKVASDIYRGSVVDVIPELALRT
jgi:hypothetical protein